MFFSTAATEVGARLDRLQARLVRPYYDVMFPLLSEAVEAGVIRPVDPAVLFFMIASAIGTTVSYSHMMLEYVAAHAAGRVPAGRGGHCVQRRRRLSAARVTCTVTPPAPTSSRTALRAVSRNASTSGEGVRYAIASSYASGFPHPSVRRT